MDGLCTCQPAWVFWGCRMTVHFDISQSYRKWSPYWPSTWRKSFRLILPVSSLSYFFMAFNISLNPSRNFDLSHFSILRLARRNFASSDRPICSGFSESVSLAVDWGFTSFKKHFSLKKPMQNGRIQTSLRESVKFLKFGKFLWSCD